LEDAKRLVGRNFIISRLKRDGSYSIPQASSVLLPNDVPRILSKPSEREAITAIIGQETEEDWKASEGEINGKTLGTLNLHNAFGVNVTRINRSGIDLLATDNLSLQMGDSAMVVGDISAIEKVEKLLGNALKRLSEPHIITIFIVPRTVCYGFSAGL
jgi:putative transport protein